MSTINISMSTSDGRSIELRHDFLSAEVKPGANESEEFIKTIKEPNKAIETFKKDEMPEDPKPEKVKSLKNEKLIQ